MSEVVRLCLLAHEAAIQDDGLTPAERPEFLHHRMKLVNGIPVFDPDKLTDDQTWDLVQRLGSITGRRRATDVSTRVTGYLAAYGRFGLRLRDVMDHTGASKPIVLKTLRELAEDGKVRIVEESTRGQAGSKRKRYFWTATPIEGQRDQAEDDMESGLALLSDRHSTTDSGIRYHGTAVQGVTCPCSLCRSALREAFIGLRVSHARSLGGTGLLQGLTKQPGLV